MLADQFVQIIRRHLKEQGIADRWDPSREIPGSPCRVTATFRRADGRILHVREATRPEPEALAIDQALNLNPAPGGIVKMIVRSYGQTDETRHHQDSQETLGHLLKVVGPLNHGDILGQILLVDASEGPEEIPQTGPNPFHGVAVDFA